jgi:hypothetical protein
MGRARVLLQLGRDAAMAIFIIAGCEKWLGHIDTICDIIAIRGAPIRYEVPPASTHEHEQHE